MGAFSTSSGDTVEASLGPSVEDLNGGGGATSGGFLALKENIRPTHNGLIGCSISRGRE